MLGASISAMSSATGTDGSGIRMADDIIVRTRRGTIATVISTADINSGTIAFYGRARTSPAFLFYGSPIESLR